MIASEIYKTLNYSPVKCLQVLKRLKKGGYIKCKELSMEEARKYNPRINRRVRGYYV